MTKPAAFDRRRSSVLPLDEAIQWQRNAHRLLDLERFSAIG
jgi:hypothetical protein